jgi:DNA-binding CsgD family transcriptional regulator/Flp pilus assembly protein TadD
MSEAAATLDEAFSQGLASDEAILLRGRLYLKKGKPSEAIALLTKALPKLRTSDRAEANILLGASHARVRDPGSARSRFAIAARELKADSPRADQLRVELACQSAAAFWIQRKVDEASKELKPALEARDAPSYVEALILKSALYAARERFENQASTLLEALRVTLAQPFRDVFAWGHIVSQLSILGRELPNRSIRDAAFEQVDKVPWTEDLADQRFIATKAVGWRRALEGDYFNAFRYLKQAAACAHTVPWRVMASCDRAYLAARLGETRWSEQELHEAAELAERVEWRAIDGEERVALLLLAELYAPHDGALALSYVARFQEIGDRFNAVLSFNADRRVDALVAYSLGYVRQHLGDSAEADEMYRKAFAIYDAIGYDWRAARAAIGLFQINGDRSWLDVAGKKLKPYPLSWLATRLSALALSHHSSLVPEIESDARRRTTRELTPAQQEVYELLLSGFPTRKIAKQLGRSEFTIRNHIKAIFKKLKVNSRAMLLSAALRA